MSSARTVPTADTQVEILIVEDDQDVQVMIERIFASNPDYGSDIDVAATLSQARELVERETYDVVLVDLGLPDSDGLRTVRSLVETVPAETAVVVLTSVRDKQLAGTALEIGAQDYIVKDDLTPALATRVVWYAMTRQRLGLELAHARRREERERELRRLERMSEDSTTSVSARMMGSGALSERLGRRYQEIEGEYSRLLLQTLDERAFRASTHTDEDLRSLAAVLGFVLAGPRDVIELHSRCLRTLLMELDPARSAALVEEARVLVLQLMGRLVSYYRDRAGRAPTRPTPTAPSPPGDGDAETRKT